MALRPNKGPMTWEAFNARLKEIYWPSLAPSMRQMTRPDAPANEPAVPDDIWQAAIVIFPDADAWLHNPTPALGGKTPLDALARREPEKVRDIIMGVADFFLPDPSEVRPWSEAEAAYAEGQALDEADGESQEKP